nr:hypothetical protein [Kocuria atrinae]
MIDQRVLLAVSTVIFTVRPTGANGSHELWMPLVRRIRDPYRGMWALPGGPLRPNEALEDSACATSPSPPASRPPTWNSWPRSVA